MVIVAAVDESEFAQAVVEEGARLAQTFGTELYVIHVMDQAEFEQRERESIKHGGQAIDMEEMRGIAKDKASDIASPAVDDFEAVGRIGDTVSKILEYVDEGDVDYLVLGGGHRSAVGKAILGSVTQDVLLSADVPVVTKVR